MSHSNRCSSEPPEHKEVGHYESSKESNSIKTPGPGSFHMTGKPGQSRGMFGKRLRVRRRSEACAENIVSEFSYRIQRGDTPIRDKTGDTCFAYSNKNPGRMGRRSSFGGLASLEVVENASDLAHVSKRLPYDDEKSISEKREVQRENVPVDKKLYPPNLTNANCSLQFEIDQEIRKVSAKILEFERGVADPNEVDNKQLESMRGDLEELNMEKEAIETSNSLDDFITRMKNSLKAIEEGVNQKTLIDLNREITPLDLPPLRMITPVDLPPLSPLPMLVLKKRRKQNDASKVGDKDKMRKDQAFTNKKGDETQGQQFNNAEAESKYCPNQESTQISDTRRLENTDENSTISYVTVEKEIQQQEIGDQCSLETEEHEKGSSFNHNNNCVHSHEENDSSMLFISRESRESSTSTVIQNTKEVMIFLSIS